MTFLLQVQKAYDTWRQAGERMVQLGHHAQHHRRWKSCQKAFKVRLCRRQSRTLVAYVHMYEAQALYQTTRVCNEGALYSDGVALLTGRGLFCVQQTIPHASSVV